LPIGSLSLYHVFAGSNTVANVSCVRGLGVLIDSNLSFAEHISHIVAKAHARACLIHKCFLSRDTATLVRALQSIPAHCWNIVRVFGPLTLRMVSTKLNLFRETSPKDREECLTCTVTDW